MRAQAPAERRLHPHAGARARLHRQLPPDWLPPAPQQTGPLQGHIWNSIGGLVFCCMEQIKS